MVALDVPGRISRRSPSHHVLPSDGGVPPIWSSLVCGEGVTVASVSGRAVRVDVSTLAWITRRWAVAVLVRVPWHSGTSCWFVHSAVVVVAWLRLVLRAAVRVPRPGANRRIRLMGLVGLMAWRRILVVVRREALIRCGPVVRAVWLTGGPRVILVPVRLDYTKVMVACCLHS